MKLHLTLILLIISTIINAQKINFPQRKINEKTSLNNYFTQKKSPKNISKPKNNSGIYKALEKFENNKFLYQKLFEHKLFKKSADTLVVGAKSNDTLVISGNWNHRGPIYILNDGVLIFKNAVVNDTGDIYVFGNGKLIADSTSFNFPQNYFYERGLLILQNAKAVIRNCSFRYSGLSHTLYLAHNAEVVMLNVNFKDWTTCGMFGSPKLFINGCNLAGEYILSDKCLASFVNTDTLILWHQIPDKAEIDFSFPNVNIVTNYKFNNAISGVKGIDYSVIVDSCTNVMWALMPVNGSKVKISNSKLRLIGNWFMRGDSAFLKGIFNNSHYTDYLIPLSDRQLKLVNTDVQTWSMYVFDSSKIFIDSCVLGEVGSQNKSGVIAVNYVCDGSGGYFWATDTSVIFANNVIVYTTVRSERNSLVILANSWLPFSSPSAIHKSILVSAQNRLASPPIAYDQSVVWNLKIDYPDTAKCNTIFPVTGSAWIKQGPGGNPMEFESYSLSFRNVSDTKWTFINHKNTSMADESLLEEWNTHGIKSGVYILRLTVKDNYGDTVEAFKVIVLEPSQVNIDKLSKKSEIKVFPNPIYECATLNFDNKGKIYNISVINSFGQKVEDYSNISNSDFEFCRKNLKSGVYFLKIETLTQETISQKIIIY